MTSKSLPWENKISNHQQLGGIETSIIDNGFAKGNRIAWVNTGSGLRYKVVLDRGMDIAEAFYNQFNLAWISHSGFTTPQLFHNNGTNWLKSFGGGLLTTCGLTHVGGPESDLHGTRGLHDRISNIPAELESIIQPNITVSDGRMSITGKMIQSQVLGPSLELRRTIHSNLGQAKISIEDTVTNLGNTIAPLMILYHFNYGWPLVDKGTQIVWNGQWVSREKGNSAKIFRKGQDFKTCKSPIADHNGNGEEAVFIDIDEDEKGNCICGLDNQQLGLGVKITFKKSELPWLTNWQHWGRNEYVTALEPGTNPPIGQSKAREEGTLLELYPGDSRSFNLEIEVELKNK